MSVVHRKGQREPKGPAPTEAELNSAFERPAHVQAVTEPAEPDADVSMSGRNVVIPDHFRAYVNDKLSRLERFDSSINRFEVVLYHEPNRRQSKQAQVVEITARGSGPVVRAEGSGENFYAATELAADRLQKRLRRSKSRNKIRKDGPGKPISVAEATAPSALPDAPAPAETDQWDDGVEPYEPGQVVRVKDHEAKPMSVDDALYEMELVGHDFFLFQDSETGKASVVYRRHAFDYGLIRLA
ncbi:MAG: ribosome-associated translation inhibitor RaiA [Gordonia sp. (in: high G+C Gram-positive bacteria)]|uniref:ribosome hibernation-promoting factor, HPF/YfiA family n=1 Tax=Gordonia sp. (in: high G+C Gram-positive bacteria) TaxID=84139 RepID=UPI0039E64DE1